MTWLFQVLQSTAVFPRERLVDMNRASQNSKCFAKRVSILRINRLGRFFVLGIAILCTGCGPGSITASDALSAAKTFVDALSLLDHASSLYRGYVNAAVLSTKNLLHDSQSGKPNTTFLPKVALNWEKKWDAVSEQTKILEKKFDEVGTASTKYWEILERVTDEIQDKNMKDGEKKKNKEAKDKWDRAYNAAKKHLAIASALRDKGNDVGRLMLTAALRGQLAEYTNTLDSIAKEAEQLLASLETITEQGRLIVNSLQSN